MTQNVTYAMTTPSFSITIAMTHVHPHTIQSNMKKIILIACLLAWQSVAAIPAKTIAHTGKPAASAGKKTATRPAKTAEKGKDKAKPSVKAKAEKEHRPITKTEKPARKTPAPAKTTHEKNAAKNGKSAGRQTAKADRHDKSKGAPPNATAKTRHTVLIKGKKYIGTPYLWGGTTPKGFDCSGLIHYLYQQEGVNIPRNSREQFSRLQATSEPQPGDLVFFRKKGVINHVGLYLGGGHMLHAPQTGMTVRVENIKRGKWPGRYAGARKVVKDKPVITLAASSKGKKAAASDRLVAKSNKAARKAADSKVRLAQRKAIAASNRRLAKESKTIHSKGRIVSAR